MTAAEVRNPTVGCSRVSPGSGGGAVTKQIIDGCGGPGGWSEGLRLLGLRDIGLEWDAAACATRAAAGHLTIRCDVAQYPLTVFRDTWGLIFSPPCQMFSSAGTGVGRQVMEMLLWGLRSIARGDDPRVTLRAGIFEDHAKPFQLERNAKRATPWPIAKVEAVAARMAYNAVLVLEPLRWALTLRPQWVAFEQVPEVLPLWQETARLLDMPTHVALLNAADFGVPQTRVRAVLVGNREACDLPTPTHTRGGGSSLFGDLAPWVPMRDVIGRVCDDDRVLSASRMERGAERTLDEPAPTVLSSWSHGGNGEWVLRTNQNNRADGSVGRYERDGRRPAPTITTHADLWELRSATTVQGADRLAKPGHRDRAGGEDQQDGAIKLTEAEGLVLQGMPSGYPLVGNKSKRWEQIGNLVPPLLAAHVVAAAANLEHQNATRPDALTGGVATAPDWVRRTHPTPEAPNP